MKKEAPPALILLVSKRCKVVPSVDKKLLSLSPYHLSARIKPRRTATTLIIAIITRSLIITSVSSSSAPSVDLSIVKGAIQNCIRRWQLRQQQASSSESKARRETSHEVAARPSQRQPVVPGSKAKRNHSSYKNPLLTTARKAQ